MHLGGTRGDSRADRSYCQFRGVSAILGTAALLLVATPVALPAQGRMRVAARVERPGVGPGLAASIRQLRDWNGFGRLRITEGVATLSLVARRLGPNGRPVAVISIQFLRN